MSICISNLDPIHPILAELGEKLEIVIYAILRDIAGLLSAFNICCIRL